MKRHFASVLVLTIAVLVAASVITTHPASASPAQAQKESLELHRSAVVNGVVLEAGTYRIELAPSLKSVEFLRGRRAVVTVPCTVSLANGRLLGNAVTTRPRTDGQEEITRIVFAASRLSIEIGPVEEVKDQPIAEVRQGR